MGDHHPYGLVDTGESKLIHKVTVPIPALSLGSQILLCHQELGRSGIGDKKRVEKGDSRGPGKGFRGMWSQQCLS